jgi:hypothetical protein
MVYYLFISLFYIQFHLARWLSIGLDPQGDCTSFPGSDFSLMQLYDIHDPCTTVGEGLTWPSWRFDNPFTSWRFDDPFLFPPDLSQGSGWHERWIGYLLLFCWIEFGRWMSVRSRIRRGPIPAFPVVTSYFYLFSSFSRFQFCRCIVASLRRLLLHF